MTHDDEYESEWADVPTGAEGPISEEALGRHLIRRGAGAAPTGLAAAIAARVAETKREPGWRRTARSLRPAAAIAACLVVVLIGGLIATAKPATNGGPGTTAFDPATRPMTVAELVRYVARGTATGETVIVDDSIDDEGTFVSCATADNCPIGVLVGYAAATQRDRSSWVFPADPAVRPDDPAIAGPLALRVRSGGGFTLLGRVAAAPATKLAWSVADVPSPSGPLDVAVIHGWLGATSIEPPCVPQSSDPAAPISVAGDPIDYSCVQISFIADAPTTAESALPAGALRVQNGSYVTFAAGPADNTTTPLKSVEGNYLVRQAVPELVCPSGPSFCGDQNPAPLGWELIARLDPVTIPAATTATPAPTPSPTPAGPLWDPTQRPLTPPEFLRVLDSRPAPGTVFIVDDQIVPAAAFCPSLGPCPNGTLQNAPVLVLPPTGGTLTFTTDSSTSTPFIGGPLAIQVGLGPFPIYLGTVVSSGQRLAVTAHDLAARNAMGGLFVVPAWIVAAFQPACPAPNGSPSPGPTSEVGLSEPDYGCAINNWLTDDEYQPDEVVDNGNSVQITATPPTDGFAIQPGAYQDFAPDPADDGHNGTLPRQGVFLVRDWAGRGEVLARLESVPIPTEAAPTPGVDATPVPTDLVPPSDAPTGPVLGPPSSPIGSFIWPSDQLVSRVRAGKIPSGRVVVMDVAESDLTLRFPADVAHSCPQQCPEWLIGPSDGQISIVESMLSPEPTDHVGRLAFIVQGDSLRLLGPIDSQDGYPQEVGGVPGEDGLFAVHGWLRDGQAVSCPLAHPTPAPLLGLDQKSLTYTCSGTWILPTADAPEVHIVSGGSEPADGSVLVQDGADGSSQTAREGSFLIRRLTCVYPALDCSGVTDGLAKAELIGEIAFPDVP